MLSRKEIASKDQLPIKSQQPNVTKGKDRQRITDVTWAVKGVIFRKGEIRAGSRGLTKYRKRIRVLKERYLRR